MRNFHYDDRHGRLSLGLTGWPSFCCATALAVLRPFPTKAQISKAARIWRHFMCSFVDLLTGVCVIKRRRDGLKTATTTDGKEPGLAPGPKMLGRRGGKTPAKQRAAGSPPVGASLRRLLRDWRGIERGVRVE